MLVETFAARLRRLRESLGHSRREVAEASGVSESAIRDYEQSKRQPSLEAALRLAVALGKKPDIWDGLAKMTTGAHKIASKAIQDAELLLGGQHKGWRLREVPTDYLEFLQDKAPGWLTPRQKEIIPELLQERWSNRRGIAREKQVAAERAEAEAREAIARAAEAAAEAEHAKAERKRLQQENLKTPPRSGGPAKPSTKPQMDDAPPWETPPGEPPPEK